jgi:hypothetical protein
LHSIVIMGWRNVCEIFIIILLFPYWFQGNWLSACYNYSRNLSHFHLLHLLHSWWVCCKRRDNNQK